MWIRTHDDQLVNLGETAILCIDSGSRSNLELTVKFSDRARTLFAFEGADSQERIILTFEKVANGLKSNKPYCDLRYILRGDEEPEEPLSSQERQKLGEMLQASNK